MSDNVGQAFSLTFDGRLVERRTLEGLSGCKPDLRSSAQKETNGSNDEQA